MANLSDEEREHIVLIENIRELLKLRAGQDFIWSILDLCDLFADTFTGNSQTYYLEGKRAIGLQIIGLLQEADPAAYPKLLLKRSEVKNGS